MIRKLLSYFLALFALPALAQTNARIVDSKSGESIPYATITYNQGEHLISNDDGIFTVPANTSDDTVLTVTFLGYTPKQVRVADLSGKDPVIKMDVGVFELQDVQVQKPDANAIMAAVRQNLSTNYARLSKPIRNRVFMRTSSLFRPQQMEVEITKSTGFTKKNLEQVNNEIGALGRSLKAQPPKEYSDRLFDYVLALKTAKNGSTYPEAKMRMFKAVKIKNENRSTDLDELQQTAMKTLLKHIDTTKYYRMKSGWFGSKDTIDLTDKKEKKKNPLKELNASKYKVQEVLGALSPLNNKTLDFINTPDRYEYKYEGAVYSDETDWVYVITFTPDSRKAKFRGKLYVSQSDFAIVRMDYKLEEGEKLEGINLKLLLGIKFAENVAKGTAIFRKDPDGQGYYLQYGARESGSYFYVHRPLKMIEITKDRSERDVVAFEFKIEGNQSEKTEYLNLSRSTATEGEYDELKEAEFKYEVLRKYDQNIWKDYGAIAPLEEMKQYQAGE